MKNILKCGIILSVLYSFPSQANYPGFRTPLICGAYSDVIGVVDLYTAAQTYSASYGVYIRLKDSNGNSYGGRIYPRSSTEYAYKQMTSIAMVSLITRTEVRMCYDGNEVYALELRG